MSNNKKAPINQQQVIRPTMVSQQAVQVHSGPLPDPETMQRYNEILPGTAERIIKVFESEVQHRHNIETERLSLAKEQIHIQEEYAQIDSRNSLLGLIFAFILGIGTIGGGVYITITKSPYGGIFLSAVGLSSLVGTFIYGTRRKAEKKNQNQPQQ